MKNIISNVKGCGCLILLILLALAFITANAQTTHTIYIPFSNKQDTKYGVAWCIDCPENAEKLNAHYWYACCSVCPYGQQIPITRPGEFWADCPADYDGDILVGNEGEYEGQDNLTPVQMAQFILDTRDELPYAIFVCLNSFDINYINDVLELLPNDTCQAIGVHIYTNVNISDHLDQICADCNIWITEIGWSNNDPNAYAIMKDLVEQADSDPRVKRIFAYTAVGGHAASLDMLSSEGLILPNGQGFIDGAYP